jgi:hypothetical protein
MPCLGKGGKLINDVAEPLLCADFRPQSGRPQHVPCVAEYRLEFSKVYDVALSDEEVTSVQRGMMILCTVSDWW